MLCRAVYAASEKHLLLVPAILFALENKRKAIVSTYTINLQEQLIYKDIPILQKLLPVEFEELGTELEVDHPASGRVRCVVSPKPAFDPSKEIPKA